jgi:hypothetical protein
MKTAYLTLMGLLAGSAGPGPVSAALITLAGGTFDVEYEQTQTSLALFGTPSVVGGNILFSANNFFAQSANGQGASSTAGSVTLYLVPHQNMQVSGLSLFAFGDYRLQGTSSYVQVSGSLAADDDNSSDPLRAASRTLNITSPATQNGQITSPLNNQNTNWQAYAGLHGNSNPWLLTSSRVAVTISSMLTAFTSSSDPDPKYAFIQEKLFVQQPAVSLTVSSDPMVVPIPPALLLLLGGGSLLGAVAVRRPRRIFAAWQATG